MNALNKIPRLFGNILAGVLMTAAAAVSHTVPAAAQQAIFTREGLVSPQVNADKSVTFRLYAPAADSVAVTGDFLPSSETDGWGTAALSEDEAGVWTLTVGPLESELYSYDFIVDGVRMTDPSNVHQMRDVRSMMSIFMVSGERGDLYSVNDVPHGTLSKVWYESESLGMRRRMTVYLPAGYGDALAGAGRRYPVLYLLHGMGGDEDAWPTLGRAAQILDNLIASGEAEPMIVVMPNGNAALSSAPGEGPDGLYPPMTRPDKTMDGSFEASFPEIIDYVDSHYRTERKPSGRAIAGLSMGGFHSYHISMQYPGTFGYVGLFSAAVRDVEEDAYGIYADSDAKLERQFSDGVSLYYIAIGRDDFLYEDNVRLRQNLDAHGYPYEYHESDGGHIWRNWRIYLSGFLRRIF